MFSVETRQSFSEFLEHLDWDVRGRHVCRVKRKWAKAKKRLRFRGCRPPRPWEKGYHSLRPYSLDLTIGQLLFPTAAFSLRSLIPPKAATGHVVTYKPIPGVLTSADIDAASERVKAIMIDKIDALERNILSGGLL